MSTRGESRPVQEAADVRGTQPSAIHVAPLARRRRRLLIGPPIRSFVATLALLAIYYFCLIGVIPMNEQMMSAGDAEGDSTRQIAFMAVFTLLFLTMLYFGSPRKLLALPLAVCVILIYCLISASWAIEPAISLRRLAFTTLIMWVIFRSVSELGYARALGVTRIALVLILIANFIVVATLPFGIHHYVEGYDTSIVGTWRGILPHKNIAGPVCAVTILLFLFDGRPLWLSVRIAVIVAATIFMIGTNSRTSEASLLFAILCGAMVRPYDSSVRSLLLPVLIIAGGILAQFMSSYPDTVLAVFSDPYGFTGRAMIWPALLTYAQDHPMTGAGFGSFWQIGPTSPIWLYATDWVPRKAGHGHNGYLDLLVTIGLPGLILAVLTILIWPMSRALLSQSFPKARRALTIAIMCFVICHNMTESSLMNSVAAMQIFMSFAIALIYDQSRGSAGAPQRLRARTLRLLNLAPADGG